jgi:adenosylcobinamide-phosphate synthase
LRRREILSAAYLLDWIAGDPEWFPHPVRLMGLCTQQGEKTLRRPYQSSSYELVAGGALTLCMVSGFYAGTARVIDWAYRRQRALGIAIEMLLAWTCLASRSLYDEARAVTDALEAEDIPLARQRLARIVGRDTQNLEAEEISRALIETVAESCSDGVIAPMFYMAIGGVPLAMAYKTINTLDSMIGHRDEQYLYFGKVAARLDDAANYLPSRLTAIGIVAAAAGMRDANAASALRTWLRDGMNHKSPNAGQPESAMAGALQVRLGGTNSYRGEIVDSPLIGAEFPRPSLKQAKRAIGIVTVVSAIGLIAVMFLRGVTRGESKRA